MDCSRARTLLWPPERPRRAGDEAAPAWAHLATCPACREYFAQDRRVIEAYGTLRSQRAPSHLREKVDALIAGERRSRDPGGPVVPVRARPGRYAPSRWLAAAALAATIGAAAVMRLLPTGPGPDAVFVEDYLRRAVSEDRITTSDRDSVARFLVRELGLPIVPLDEPDLELVSAEICLLEGLRGAMILYRLRGEAVTHYVVPRRSRTTEGPSVSARASHDAAGSPPTVVTWVDRSAQQALVSGLPADRLLSLARRARPAGR